MQNAKVWTPFLTTTEPLLVYPWAPGPGPPEKFSARARPLLPGAAAVGSRGRGPLLPRRGGARRRRGGGMAAGAAAEVEAGRGPPPGGGPGGPGGAALAGRAGALRARDAAAAAGLPGGSFRGAWGALAPEERRRVYGEARGMVKREALCVLGAGSVKWLLAGSCPELVSDAWATLKGEPVVALVEAALAGPPPGSAAVEEGSREPWPPLPGGGGAPRARPGGAWLAATLGLGRPRRLLRTGCSACAGSTLWRASRQLACSSSAGRWGWAPPARRRS